MSGMVVLTARRFLRLFLLPRARLARRAQPSQDLVTYVHYVSRYTVFTTRRRELQRRISERGGTPTAKRCHMCSTCVRKRRSLPTDA